MVPRLQECCRQGQEGEVDNDRNIILETWGSLFWRITKVLKGEFITLPTESIQDCGDLLRSSHHLMEDTAGIHEFQFDGAPKRALVECDSDGWTIIQSRGQFDNRNAYFYRRWDSYVDGFGVPGAEYWLGLDNIFFLARQKNYELRVTLTDADGEEGVGIWHSFKLDNRARAIERTFAKSICP